MKRMLDFLTVVAKRPGMYLGPLTYMSVWTFLFGLKTGYGLSGIEEYSSEHYLAAAESRGWNPRGNIGILRDFTRKGLSEEEMAHELIAVEIEAYQRAMQDREARSQRKSKS